MANHRFLRAAAAVIALAPAGFTRPAHADDTIKIGLSVPLSGPPAVWGRGGDWMCKKAAQEIKDAGGVKVGDTVHNFECVSYDNHFNAADGTKVAQALLNREGVKFINCVISTAALHAMQTLSERQGAVLFNQSWGLSSKGPKFPLTFTIVNTPIEILPAMIQYIRQTHPEAKTMAMLNVNDASGRETESISRPMWEKAGVKVVSSEFYERGTTEFQPIAARLASLNADIINLGTAPPADAGQVFKELAVLGFHGVRLVEAGTGVDGLKATGGPAVDGVYLGAAVPFDGPSATEHMRELNVAASAYIGESPSLPSIGCYDPVYVLKAAMEKAQSIDPKAVAAAIPTVKFKTFYGGETGFGGKEFYGSDQQAILPVYITQIENGQLVERARIDRPD